MSEISGEKVEKTEAQNTETKEMTTADKFDSFTDEEKQDVLVAEQKFKAEHPDEKFDTKAYIDQKFKEKNGDTDDSETSEDDEGHEEPVIERGYQPRTRDDDGER